MNKFDYSLRSYDERNDYINKLLESNIEEFSNPEMLQDDKTMRDKETILERCGTYLLESKGLLSERSLEESFYITESQYRKRAIGKNSISTDIEQREDLHQHYDEHNELHTKLNNQYIYRLFNLNKMDFASKKRLLKFGLKQKDNPENELSKTMEDIYEMVVETIQNQKDRDTLDLFISGLTEQEIAIKQNVSQQAINKRICKIIENF